MKKSIYIKPEGFTITFSNDEQSNNIIIGKPKLNPLNLIWGENYKTYLLVLILLVFLYLVFHFIENSLLAILISIIAIVGSVYIRKSDGFKSTLLPVSEEKVNTVSFESNELDGFAVVLSEEHINGLKEEVITNKKLDTKANFFQNQAFMNRYLLIKLKGMNYQNMFQNRQTTTRNLYEDSKEFDSEISFLSSVMKAVKGEEYTVKYQYFMHDGIYLLIIN